MRISIAVFITALGVASAAGATSTASATSAGMVARGTMPAVVPEGPQIFIDDTNTAIILAPVAAAPVPVGSQAVPSAQVVSRTDFDRSRLGPSQDLRGIGTGPRDNTTPGPVRNEPTVAPQTSEPQIGQQGAVIVPGLSDQGPVFPQPNTVTVAPQLSAGIPPAAPSAVILPGLSDQGLIFPAPNTVAVAPQLNTPMQSGFGAIQPGTAVIANPGTVLVPVNPVRRTISPVVAERLEANRAAAAARTAPGTSVAPAPAGR